MIKLIIAIILFLSSLLVIFRAPHSYLWLAAVIVTNYCHILLLLSLSLAIFSLRSASYRGLTLGFCLAAMIIFAIPLVIAAARSGKLKKELNSAFPINGSIDQPAFSWLRLFRFRENIHPKTMMYKRVDSTVLSLDFYKSMQAGPRPLVVMIHGGAWMRGSKDDLSELNYRLSSKGYDVAAINYRLAPQYKFPAPVEDVYDAVQYLVKEAANLGIDTNNIFLMGRSAGGQIGLVAAYTSLQHQLKGVIAYYPPADMVWGGQIHVSKWIIDTDLVYDSYFGGQYDEVPDVFKAASARDQVNGNAVPTLLVHGSNDPMVSPNHCTRLQQTLNAFHIPNYFLEIPFATHGFDYNLNGPSGQLAAYAVEYFLKSRTNQ